MLIFIKVQWQNFTGRKCLFLARFSLLKRERKTNRIWRAEKIRFRAGNYQKEEGRGLRWERERVTIRGEWGQRKWPGKESRTAWKETRRGGGRINTRSESKLLEISRKGRENRVKTRGSWVEIKQNQSQSKRNGPLSK